MTNLSATFFVLRQFISEYAPFFLAAWLSLAVTTGLIGVLQRKGIDPKSPDISFLKHHPLRWLWRLLVSGLWRPGGKEPSLSTFSGLALFSLTASVPALIATSIFSMEAVWLRLGLTALFALSSSWFVTTVILHRRRQGSLKERQQKVEIVSSSSVLNGDATPLQPERLHSLAQVIWQSFTGQLKRATVPLIIGFILTSALTIYAPRYAISSWLGEGAWQGPYLAALLTIPLQLTSGAEVLLASALSIKGASLGTVLSVMLVAPSTTFSVIHHLSQPVQARTTALYIVSTWFVAGSLGVVTNGFQRLFGV